MASFNAPAPNNGIIADVNAIHELLTDLAKMRPDLATNVPEGAWRFVFNSTGEWLVLQQYVDGQWTQQVKVDINANHVRGYHPNTSAVAGTIPVYNASGQLVGNITGNAVTATQLANPRSIQVGGILSSTAQNFNGTANVTIPVNQVTINNEADTAVNGTLTKAHGGTGRTDGASSDVVVTGTASSILAKSVGQIGQAKVVASTTNLDSVIDRGLYICQGNMTIADNNVPEPNGANPCFLEVSHQGNYIIQRWELINRQWQRRSTDKGASWGLWYPLGGFRGNIIIYISKSGSDSNTGLDSAYPVLTFARVFQILDGLAQGAASINAYVRIGAGEWGDLTIADKPYTILLNPYDGQMPNAASASLPIFSSINIYGTRAYVGGLLIYGFLQAFYNASIYVQNGYKRIWWTRAGYTSVINFESDSADTNLLEMGGQTPSRMGFQTEDGGCIILNAIKIKLISNITYNQFLRVAGGSKIFISSSLTQFLASPGTFTGAKYIIDSGGEVLTGENTTGVPAILNSLPGTQAGTSYAASIFNGWPRDAITGSNVVTINSEQTITGQKIFKNAKGLNALKLIGTNINLANLPSAEQILGITFTDAAEVDRVQFMLRNRTDNNIYLVLRMLNPANGVTPSLTGIYNRVSGISYWACDVPQNSANANEIATAGWVRARIAEEIAKIDVGGSKKVTQLAHLSSVSASGTGEGTWTITGCTIDAPLYILYSSENTNMSGCFIRVSSGATGGYSAGTSSLDGKAFLLGGLNPTDVTQKRASTDCFICIPTATSVVIHYWKMESGTGNKLWAFQ